MRYFLFLFSFFFSSPVWATSSLQRQLLFQVKTDKYPDKLYQFYGVSIGKEQKLLYLEYYRKTRIIPPKSVPTTQSVIPRYVIDPCYPFRMTIQQIQQGIYILRNNKALHFSPMLQKLVDIELSGGTLSPEQKKRKQQEMVPYCAALRKSQTGRIINSIRGYGHNGQRDLDPIKGGKIVVTYLQNALLNFFKGRHRYIILRIEKERFTANDGKTSTRWRLLTKDGQDASKLFFKTHPLGIDAIMLGLQIKHAPPIVRALDCTVAIDPQSGSCVLQPQERKKL